ncbi:hypothetical protein Tco_0707764 [Tanacetum coccineum]
MASPPYNLPSQSSPIKAFNLDDGLESLGSTTSQPSLAPKKNEKDLVDPWSFEEEIALCNAWWFQNLEDIENHLTRHFRFNTHIGLGQNDEATDSEDVEVQEVRPMGRDKSKKKASSSTVCLESSVAGEASLVDELLNKWSHVAYPLILPKSRIFI